MIEDYEYQVRVKALEIALSMHGHHANAADLVKSAMIIEDYIRGREKR